MSITEQGIQGEKNARIFLKKQGIDGLFQADWIVEKDNKNYVIEVKHKEKFKAPPFDGHGLDIRQVKARMNFYKTTGVRCMFLVFDIDGTIYWRWLDKLESSNFITTSKDIRVDDIRNFHSCKNSGDITNIINWNED